MNERPMPKGLTADQCSTLSNMRKELERMVMALFPKSSDKGMTELAIVMAKAESLYNEVIPMSDALFLATVRNEAPRQITNEGMSDFLSNEFLNRFCKWSKDELILLLVIIHTDRAISDRNYRGLPHSEEAAASIIKLPNL